MMHFVARESILPDSSLVVFTVTYRKFLRTVWYFRPEICKFDIRRTVDQNQQDALISQIYFWNRTLHVSDSFSVHHPESSTVHTAIGICHTGYADRLPASNQHNLYDIYLLLCVQC